MPATITISPKKIALDYDLSTLLHLYRCALEDVAIKVEHDNNGPKSSAAMEQPRDRDDIWSNWIFPAIKLISRIDFKTTVLELPPLKIEIDPPAEILLNGYLKFLNSLLREQGLGPDDTQKNEICSKFVVVRELLYRLVAIGLSKKSNHDEDGERLMNALNIFIIKIKESKLLEEKHLLSHATSTSFLSSLSDRHPQWSIKISNMILSVSKMRHHQQVISNILTNLNTIKQAIQAHIMACLNPGKNPNDFNKEWLLNTLPECEQSWLQRTMPKNLGRQLIQVPILAEEDRNHTSRQATIITMSLQTRVESGYPHAQPITQWLSLLYSLLNLYSKVYEVMSHLDLLITHGSWGTILAGLINFGEISRLLEYFLDKCLVVVATPPNLKNIIKTSSGLGLIRNDLLNIDAVKQLIIKNALDLRQLDDPALHEEISRMIGANLSGLVQLQQQFHSSYQIVDESRLQALGLNGRFLIASPKPPSRQLQIEELPKKLKLFLSLSEQNCQW